MPVSVTVAENSRVAPIHCNSLTNSSPTDSRPSLAARKGSAPSAGGPSRASVLVSFGVVDSPVAVVKVGRRGERVERGSIRGMVLSKVVEDVHDGVTDGARGGERAPMPAIRPKGTAPKDEPIHAARDANGEPAHARAERTLVECLHHEVHVIRLRRKVDDAKCVRSAPICRRDGEAHRRKHILAPQRPQLRTQRHVDGMRLRMFTTPPMRNARPHPHALAPGSTTATPPALGKRGSP